MRVQSKNKEGSAMYGSDKLGFGMMRLPVESPSE